MDDALDGITHAVRGDDHLTNSAYQVWLLQKLGYSAPVYMHHGLLLGDDGAKLSKRSGSHSVAELREDGLLPLALLQTMTRLGHPNIDESAHTLASLVAAFAAEQVSTSSVKWSNTELWRWHARLLHGFDAESLATMIQPFFPNEDPERLIAFAQLIGRNIERVSDAGTYRRLLEPDAYPDDASVAVLQQAGADFYRVALDLWREQDGSEWKPWADAIKTATGCKGRALFMPLRVALSGAMHGPEMSAVVAFLGRDAVAIRLEDAMRVAQ